MNFPSPDNPLILHYRGRIPALKNDKVLITKKGGDQALIPDKDVLEFFKRVKSLQRQVDQQGFNRMHFPTPVACHVTMYFRINEIHHIPTSDGDNAYTTIQETWQYPAVVKTMGAVLGVIDNDRQVLECHWRTIAVPVANLEGATAFLWQHNPNQGFEEMRLFMDWHDKHLTPDPGREDETIDFDDLGGLW